MTDEIRIKESLYFSIFSLWCDWQFSWIDMDKWISGI